MVALALAFAVVIGGSARTTSGVTGQAASVPLPLPPQIGSCVTLSADNSGADGGQQHFEMVQCDSEHDGEITMTWNAGVEPQSMIAKNGGGRGFRLGSGTVSSLYFICADWNQTYIGVPTRLGDGPWWPVWLSFGSGFITAPAGERAGALGWSACIIEPSTPVRYLGSVRNATVQHEQGRPGAFAPCMTERPGEHTETIYSTCAQPHRVESMAVNYGLDPAVPTEQALSRCVAIVGQLTGAGDPTYGGRLAIEVRTAGLRAMTLVQIAALPEHAYPNQECTVTLVGPGALVGSVVGLGDAELPVI